MKQDACAIVITYYPQNHRLKQLVSSLLVARLKVIVVDNTPQRPLNIDLPQSCNIVMLGDNYGIAQAQNIGICKARDEGAEIIVFLDQDSTIQAGVLERLISLVDPNEPQVVGAVYTDDRQGFECPSYRLNRFGYPTKVYIQGRSAPFPVDVRISSGSVVTAVTFDYVGLMDEGLFLDYVDIEWCLRARAKGVPILIDPLALMQHHIGDKTFNFLNLCVFVDSPTRTYYRIRNAFLLARKNSVPLLFVTKEVASELLHHFLQIIFVESKVKRFRAYILGVWHGLRGICGRKP